MPKTFRFLINMLSVLFLLCFAMIWFKKTISLPKFLKCTENMSQATSQYKFRLQSTS